jgi:hypothetical protein
MAVVTPTAKSQFIGADGVPLSGGKVYTYIAGTTLPQATYTDYTGAVANSNPVILDARGEASIWLGEATYKFKLTDADDVEIWTVDYIAAPTTALSPVLSGNVIISTDSSGPALKITQTGTGPVLRVQDETDPDATPFIITSSGYVGIGTVAPSEALDIDNDGKIQLSAAGIARTTISADASNSIFAAAGARNFVIKTANATRQTIDGVGDTTFTGSVTATTFYGDWENLPAGTAMLFVQTAAPTGWTKSTTHNNKALRVVSGAASSGGSVAFTTAFASQAVTGTVASYTLTTSDIPSHNHSASSSSSSSSSVSDPGHAHSYTAGGAAGFAYQAGFSAANSSNPFGATTGGSGTGISVSTSTSTSTSIGNTGGGGGHAHGFSAPNINLAVQYVDVIIATKD